MSVDSHPLQVDKRFIEKNSYIERQVEMPGISVRLRSGRIPRLLDIRDNPQHHEMMLMLSPLPNELEYYIPSTGSRQPFELGNLSLRPSGISTRIIALPGAFRILVFRIDPEYFQHVTGKEGNWDLDMASNIMGTPMNATLLRVGTEMSAPGFASDDLVTLLSKSVVIDLARLAQDGSLDKFQSTSNGLSSAQMQRIMDYIENVEDQPLTVTDMARHVGLSYRHLTRMFRASTSRTLHAYVSEVRIRKAIMYLTSSDMSAKEISYKLGFKTPCGFSSVFQSATGQTPTQFRRNFQASNTAADKTPMMARKRHTAEEIAAKLSQVDALCAQGKSIADAIRTIGVTEVTYYRWRNEQSKTH